MYRYAHHGMMKAACDATDEKNRNKCPFCYIFAKKQKKEDTAAQWYGNVFANAGKLPKLKPQD